MASVIYVYHGDFVYLFGPQPGPLEDGLGGGGGGGAAKAADA